MQALQQDPWLLALSLVVAWLLFVFVASVSVAKDLIRLWWLPRRTPVVLIAVGLPEPREEQER